MIRRVLVPIADGTEELEAVAIIDVLRRAGADVTVSSVKPGQLQVTASRKVKLVADRLIADCTGETFDLIVLPGGIPGAEHLRDCSLLIDMLKTQKESGRLYAAICASPAVVFQHHGILDNRKATCHPSFRDRLPKEAVSDERVVVDGNCVTSQAPGTAVEFALKLVELLYGSDKAQKVAAPLGVN